VPAFSHPVISLINIRTISARFKKFYSYELLLRSSYRLLGSSCERELARPKYSEYNQRRAKNNAKLRAEAKSPSQSVKPG
jgi:hypothetical protein